jgi:hypothetical protein
LGVEIGIASWSIRRANRYWSRESAAKRTSEQIAGEQQSMTMRIHFLNNHVSEISWLLNFLYNRYNKFVDLETEIRDGLDGVTGDTSTGEADDKYKDLNKAWAIIGIMYKHPNEESEENQSEFFETDKSVKGESEPDEVPLF